MAFNPFEAFSIRSKLGRSVMAVLGIVVMLTFVLSTGAVGSRNDFFDQVGSMFSSRGRGEVVAVAYGNDVYDGDLTEIRRQRQAANAYMQSAVDTAYVTWARDLAETLKTTRITAETKRDVERFVAAKAKSDTDPREYAIYRESLRLYLSRDFRPETQEFFMRGAREAQNLSQCMVRAQLKPESEDKRFMDAVAAILTHDLSPIPFFIVPLSWESDRSLLDFYLLLKKADQLGIHFSEEGVLELIKQDTLGRLGTRDGIAIQQRMRDGGRFSDFTPAWLTNAIRNEYRVRTALAALQGQSPDSVVARLSRNEIYTRLFSNEPTSAPAPGLLSTLGAMPGAATPHDFFEFYKDKCSEHTFALLELSAEDFLKDVKGEPDKNELKNLFNKHRGDLPDPSKDRPGFKEPRKVKVEYVTLDATGPRITQAIPKVQAASIFLCASAGAIAGDPVSALASAAQPSIAETLPIKQGIAEKMESNYSRYQPAEQWFTWYAFRDVSVYRPQPIAALLAGFAGYPCPTAAMTPVTMAFRQIEHHDLSIRIPFMLQGWLTPFNPTFGNALGMPAFAYALNPKLPPEGLYRKEAVETAKKRQRQELFEADIRELRSKLFKISMDSGRFTDRSPDKTKLEKAKNEAKKTLTEWLKDRNLTPLTTKAPVDQFTIITDADLKALNDLAAQEPDGSNSFSNRLFAVDPQSRTPRNDVQPFEPFWFPGEPSGDGVDKPNHFVWVSEEFDAKAYNSLDNANADNHTKGEMTKRVERAWRLEKARALAKAEAERIAEQVRGIAKTVATNPTGVTRQLLDLAAEKKGRLIELDRLALLKFQPEATGARLGYEPPKIERNQVLYPTADFTDKLLELRKQPLGSVTVLEDAPRTRYYVACEVARFEKSVDQFRDVFVKSTGTGAAQNPLYERFVLPDERSRAIKEVFERLRADAKLEEKEAFKDREKRDAE